MVAITDFKRNSIKSESLNDSICQLASDPGA